MEETSIQCGFCIPGFIMTAVEILDRGVYYTDGQLRKLLSGHLCRCTGYENIFKAVKKPCSAVWVVWMIRSSTPDRVLSQNRIPVDDSAGHRRDT